MGRAGGAREEVLGGPRFYACHKEQMDGRRGAWEMEKILGLPSLLDVLSSVITRYHECRGRQKCSRICTSSQVIKLLSMPSLRDPWEIYKSSTSALAFGHSPHLHIISTLVLNFELEP
jgi:hypothetical protein